MQFRPEIEDVLSPQPSLPKQSSVPLHLPQIVADENNWNPNGMSFHDNLDLMDQPGHSYQYQHIGAAGGLQASTGVQTQVRFPVWCTNREYDSRNN